MLNRAEQNSQMDTEPVVSVNDIDVPRSKVDAEISRWHSVGEDATVQYPDGALWCYTVSGRCIKLNNL